MRSFLGSYQWIILFYLLVIAFLYWQRKRLDIQGKIIILYRTTVGLHVIERCATKYKEWVRLYGYIGVGAGFLGLAFMFYALLKNLYQLMTQPDTASGVSIVLPGVSVPGLGVLPFWYWILAIFLIAAVHEFSHGIVARAQAITVKNTGLVFLGPIIGAFVEPDEVKMRKQPDITQYSILAAGSFANLLLAVVAIIILGLVFLPLQERMEEPSGFTFHNYYQPGFPVEQAGIAPGTVITGINGQQTKTFQDFYGHVQCLKPSDSINITTTNQTYALILAEDPQQPGKSFLGVQSVENAATVKPAYQTGGKQIWYQVIKWIVGFLRWLFLLSLGIGLFNLLPLPIVDGGRMMQVTLHKISGPDKGERQYRWVALLTLAIVLLNLVYPWLAKLFS